MVACAPGLSEQSALQVLGSNLWGFSLHVLSLLRMQCILSVYGFGLTLHSVRVGRRPKHIRWLQVTRLTRRT